MCDEVDENGTYYTHVYITLANGVPFNTLKNKFPPAHWISTWQFPTEEGKWLKDKKKETNLQETFEEEGELPIERQGARNDLADLYDQIKTHYIKFYLRFFIFTRGQLNSLLAATVFL